MSRILVNDASGIKIIDNKTGEIVFESDLHRIDPAFYCSNAKNCSHVDGFLCPCDDIKLKQDNC